MRWYTKQRGLPFYSRTDCGGRNDEAADTTWAAWPVRSLDMDGVREFLEEIMERGHAQGNFLGLLHLLIGRRLTRPDGTVISTGQTWREAAALLKKVRWDKSAVRELGQDPAALPPRDRERFWYVAIAHANVGSDQATQAGNRLAEKLHAAGYTVSPPPGT